MQLEHNTRNVFTHTFTNIVLNFYRTQVRFCFSAVWYLGNGWTDFAPNSEGFGSSMYWPPDEKADRRQYCQNGSAPQYLTSGVPRISFWGYKFN